MDRVHFIGIGGIGMSALAAIALQKGMQVSGSDLHSTSITESLKEKGVKIKIGHEKNQIQSDQIVVYSSAIRPDNPEWIQAKELGVPLYHRSDFLAFCMKGKKKIMVTGAHGKTTTTALLVHIFYEAGIRSSYLIGGTIPDRFHGYLTDSDWFIFEGDESDGSFLKADPDFAIFTNIDHEHLDYWKTFDQLLEGYQQALQKSKDRSRVWVCQDDPHLSSLNQKRFSSYGFNQQATVFAHSIQFIQEGMRFQIADEESEETIQLPLYGEHHVKNATACFALAKQYGIPLEVIKRALATFKGVSRRFEKIGTIKGTIFVDDYAHHPAEIDCLTAVLEKLTQLSKVLIVFQPHRFSRLKSLKSEFIRSLSKPFDLIALPIYAASEEVDLKWYQQFLEELNPRSLIPLEREEALNWIKNNYFHYDYVVTVGAGDVTEINRQLMKQNG